MSVLQSRLAKRHPSLATEIEQLLTGAQNLGATAGVQRTSLICDQYDKLSPDAAYRWIDPGAFQHEVEDAQSHKIEMWHIVRNCLSLLPLVVTWFALFSAATGYQHDLSTYGDVDKGQSFLALWQNGFHGTTWFTFSVAALLDITLLLLYLSFIILTYWLERRAYSTATNFAQQLQVSTEELMRVIASDGITPIASEADVDRVSNAVQHVVDKAVQMSEQIVQAAQQSIEQLVQTVQQSNQQVMEATQQSNQQTVQTVQHSNQQVMEATQQSNQQLVHTIQQSKQQAAQTAQQTIEQVAQAVQQSNQQAIQSIQQVTQQIIQAAEQSSQQLMRTAQQAIADSNRKVETLFDNQLMPMMAAFNADMVRLHRELANYQGRLNDLTVASKQLANASGTLISNAGQYMTIGKEISEQITALNTTQQHVLTQIGAIAGNISSAAENMSTATANMSAATISMTASTRAVETVATQLTGGMQMTINTMTNQVGRATQSLGQVGTELQTTTYHLQKAAVILSSLQFSGRGGLIGWFFSRRYNRRKSQGQGALYQ